MIKEELIGAYFDKEKLNFEKLLEDYQSYITAIIRNFGTIKAEDEEEIISDVFLVLWKNSEKLNKNLKFSPYIAGITRRIIFKKYKELSNEFSIEDYDKILVSRFNVDKIIEEKEVNNTPKTQEEKDDEKNKNDEKNSIERKDSANLNETNKDEIQKEETKLNDDSQKEEESN